VAESTVQMGYFFMVKMIKENGLFDRNRSINRKDGKEEAFSLNPKSMVGNCSKQENDYNNNKNGKSLSHLFIRSMNLYTTISYSLTKKASEVNKVNSVVYNEK
jgi:hypothetical protein